MVQQMAVSAAGVAGSNGATVVSTVSASAAVGAASGVSATTIAVGAVVGVSTVVGAGVLLNGKPVTAPMALVEQIGVCRPDPVIREGYMQLSMYPQDFRSVDALENAFVEAYNTASPLCWETFERSLHNATLENVQFGAGQGRSLLTTWSAMVSCYPECPLHDPLFGTELSPSQLEISGDWQVSGFDNETTVHNSTRKLQENEIRPIDRTDFLSLIDALSKKLGLTGVLAGGAVEIVNETEQEVIWEIILDGSSEFSDIPSEVPSSSPSKSLEPSSAPSMVPTDDCTNACSAEGGKNLYCNRNSGTLICSSGKVEGAKCGCCPGYRFVGDFECVVAGKEGGSLAGCCEKITQSPSESPSDAPSSQPSNSPSSAPSSQPSSAPSAHPSSMPSERPSRSPTDRPSSNPTATPGNPTATPTTAAPSHSPSGEPSAGPSANPSVSPSSSPSTQPTAALSNSPSVEPSSDPSAGPSTEPSQSSMVPTAVPTVASSDSPSVQPSFDPSATPSSKPSSDPTAQPSPSPSDTPSTSGPTFYPTRETSLAPSTSPTADNQCQASCAKISPANPNAAFGQEGDLFCRTEDDGSMSFRCTKSDPRDNNGVGNSGWGCGCCPGYRFDVDKCQVSEFDEDQVLGSCCVLITDSPTASPTDYPSQSPTRKPTEGPTVEASSGPTASPSSSPTSQPSMPPSASPSQSPTETLPFSCGNGLQMHCNGGGFNVCNRGNAKESLGCCDGYDYDPSCLENDPRGSDTEACCVLIPTAEPSPGPTQVTNSPVEAPSASPTETLPFSCGNGLQMHCNGGGFNVCNRGNAKESLGCCDGYDYDPSCLENDPRGSDTEACCVLIPTTEPSPGPTQGTTSPVEAPSEPTSFPCPGGTNKQMSCNPSNNKSVCSNSKSGSAGCCAGEIYNADCLVSGNAKECCISLSGAGTRMGPK